MIEVCITAPLDYFSERTMCEQKHVVKNEVLKLGCQCNIFLTLPKSVASGSISACSQKYTCLLISQGSCNGLVLKIINNLNNERTKYSVKSAEKSKLSC